MKKNIILIVILFAIQSICSISLFAQPDKEYFYRLGTQNMSEGKFSQAIDNFNTLIKADTTLYEAYFLRGTAKYNLNDYIGALYDFNKAIQKNPVFTQAYHYRAITFSQLGRFDDAMKDYDHVLDLRPDYLGVYYSRGVSLLMSQQLDKAIADFNRYIRFEPQSSDSYINRGTAYLLKKDTVRAMADYNKAININMLDAQAYARRARIYSMRGENEKAMKDLNESIRLDSTGVFSYFNRALVHYNMKDINAALKDLAKVLSYDPDNALTLYNRALINSQIGDYNSALADYARVIEINPGNVLVYYNRAAIFAEQNNYVRAINDYSKAIELYPDFANAYMNRSRLRSMLGQFNESKKDYEIAQKKIAQYRSQMNDSTFSIYADTSKKFNQLLALDADFTKKTLANNTLQNNKIGAVLKPMTKFMVDADKLNLPLDKQYFLSKLEQFKSIPEMRGVDLSAKDDKHELDTLMIYDSIADDLLASQPNNPLSYFYKAMVLGQMKQFASAINYYNKAIELDNKNPFLYLNRSTIQAEMIDFISNIESNMPNVSLDGTTVSPMKVVHEKRNTRVYDYNEAITDLERAEKIAPNFAYIYYNRGNLKCISDKMPEAIEDYSRAIKLYPYFAEAYFNRGMAQIYIRDTEKGCLDISKSGELGIDDAYDIIKKYCLKDKK